MSQVNAQICNYLMSNSNLPWNNDCCSVMTNPPKSKCSLINQGITHCHGGDALCTYKGGLVIGGGDGSKFTNIEKADLTGGDATYLVVGGGTGDGRSQMDDEPIGGWILLL